MILLWGVPGDGPLDAVHASLVRLGVDFRLLDQRDAAGSAATLRVEGQRLMLEVEGPRETDRLDFERVGAAYLRPVETARAVPCAADDDAARRADDVDRAMVTWADLASAFIVNRPAAMAVNNSKPYQLRLIASYGFPVPETLVTTDPAAVSAFAQRHRGVVYKSVSGVRSIVSVLGAAGLERLDDVANCPTQFQEEIRGVDVRVHVVGDEIYGTRVRSDAQDYRYASLSGETATLEPVGIPDAIAVRCRAMTAGMGLAVAGIDFRRTIDDRWVCFEVNPSPGFIFYEEATGQPIASAIARLLAREDAARGRGAIGRRRLAGAHGGWTDASETRRYPRFPSSRPSNASR